MRFLFRHWLSLTLAVGFAVVLALMLISFRSPFGIQFGCPVFGGHLSVARGIGRLSESRSWSAGGKGGLASWWTGDAWMFQWTQFSPTEWVLHRSVVTTFGKELLRIPLWGPMIGLLIATVLVYAIERRCSRQAELK